MGRLNDGPKGEYKFSAFQMPPVAVGNFVFLRKIMSCISSFAEVRSG